MTDVMGLMSMYRSLAAALGRELHEATIPEPEFKPFRLEGKETAKRARAITPANVASAPRTLAELGVPGPLAREMEATFRAMGLTRGARVVGYTFAAADGSRHALRVTDLPAREEGGLAA